MNVRIGVGYDLHRLVEGRTLMLGCIAVPASRGLAGHSDGDAVAHAVADALLGAAGLGDIGAHFPPDDPRYEGIAGRDLLRQVCDMLAAGGWSVVNVDVTIVAEAPKLAPHRDAMRASMAEVLGIDAGSVGIKAKTNEGLDALGRGEAIAAHAVALIQQGGA